jgi:glycerate-2-kinase
MMYKMGRSSIGKFSRLLISIGKATMRMYAACRDMLVATLVLVVV